MPYYSDSDSNSNKKSINSDVSDEENNENKEKEEVNNERIEEIEKEEPTPQEEKKKKTSSGSSDSSSYEEDKKEENNEKKKKIKNKKSKKQKKKKEVSSNSKKEEKKSTPKKGGKNNKESDYEGDSEEEKNNEKKKKVASKKYHGLPKYPPKTKNKKKKSGNNISTLPAKNNNSQQKNNNLEAAQKLIDVANFIATICPVNGIKASFGKKGGYDITFPNSLNNPFANGSNSLTVGNQEFQLDENNVAHIPQTIGENEIKAYDFLAKVAELKTVKQCIATICNVPPQEITASFDNKGENYVINFTNPLNNIYNPQNPNAFSLKVGGQYFIYSLDGNNDISIPREIINNTQIIKTIDFLVQQSKEKSIQRIFQTLTNGNSQQLSNKTNNGNNKFNNNFNNQNLNNSSISSSNFNNNFNSNYNNNLNNSLQLPPFNQGYNNNFNNSTFNKQNPNNNNLNNNFNNFNNKLNFNNNSNLNNKSNFNNNSNFNTPFNAFQSSGNQVQQQLVQLQTLAKNIPGIKSVKADDQHKRFWIICDQQSAAKLRDDINGNSAKKGSDTAYINQQFNTTVKFSYDDYKYAFPALQSIANNFQVQNPKQF